MKYTAGFQIDCGVSHGQGSKYPENYERKERIEAETDVEALKGAYQIAVHLSREQLSNPDAGLTAVLLKSLSDSTGRTVPQELITSQFPSQQREGKLFIERSMLEHILNLLRNPTPD